MLCGIDVSFYQGNINWTEVKAGGIQFAFIKASEGLSIVDPKFSQNWKGCADVGIPCGPYHFWRPQSDPYAQASLFLKTVDSELGYRPTLPAVIDLETFDSLMGVNQQVDNVMNFLAIVDKSIGMDTIIYANPGTLQQLGFPSLFTSRPLWIANPEVEAPHIKPWDMWTFWQYSFKGQCAGVPDAVDLDYFNGDYEGLVKLGTPRTSV